MFTLLSSFILMLPSIRGIAGNPPAYQTGHDTSVGSPFELSNSTARYALTKSIVEDRSLLLNEDLAHFASPDVVDYKGKFMSIFTPGISFIGIPFYLIGKLFGLPQIGAYFLNVALALLCIYLIAALARILGASVFSSYTGGLLFIFASNALVYTQSYSQHIASSALLIGIVCLAFSNISILRMILLGALTGCALLVDIPNLFLILPILIYTIIRNILVTRTSSDIKISIRFHFLAIVLGIVPLMGIFGWYNHSTTGSFTKLAQSIGRSHVFRDALEQNPTDLRYDLVSTPETSTVLHLPFDSRHLIRGGYVLLFSDERSWLWYSPVILLGVIGLYVLIQNPRYVSKATILFSVVGINILLYAMFGDPWGGWAFGPRYLIPSAAILSVGIAIAMTQFWKKWLFHIIFILLLGYSVSISVLGAVTTSAIPPVVEAVNLSKRIPHTYKLNQQMITNNNLSSLAYDAILRTHISPQTFWIGYSATIILFILSYYLLSVRNAEKRKSQ